MRQHLEWGWVAFWRRYGTAEAGSLADGAEAGGEA